MHFIQQQVQLHAGDRRRRFHRHVSLLAAHGPGPELHNYDGNQVSSY